LGVSGWKLGISGKPAAADSNHQLAGTLMVLAEWLRLECILTVKEVCQLLLEAHLLSLSYKAHGNI
jgi:hypothetical protein